VAASIYIIISDHYQTRKYGTYSSWAHRQLSRKKIVDSGWPEWGCQSRTCLHSNTDYII